MQISTRAFERDSYSNAYLLAKFGFDTAENEPSFAANVQRTQRASAGSGAKGATASAAAAARGGKTRRRSPAATAGAIALPIARTRSDGSPRAVRGTFMFQKCRHVRYVSQVLPSLTKEQCFAAASLKEKTPLNKCINFPERKVPVYLSAMQLASLCSETELATLQSRIMMRSFFQLSFFALLPAEQERYLALRFSRRTP